MPNREPATIEDGHHEFRVVAVAEADPKLTLEYIRRLPPDEWRWYVGGQGNANLTTGDAEADESD